MHLLLIGATGATGRHILTQALAEGHSVTALARDPTDLRNCPHPALHVVPGNVLIPDTLAAAMRNRRPDAVLVALSGAAGKHNTVLTSGTANIIWQMHQFSVQRLVVLSALGAGESRRELGWLTRWLLNPLFRPHRLQQKSDQESMVRSSGLDWVIVRPTALTDEPATGRVFAGVTLRDQPELYDSVSRADVAAFMLAQLRHDRWLRQPVALTGADRAFEDLTPNSQPETVRVR